MSTQPQARITGTLERIVFSNEDNAWTVGEFRIQESGESTGRATTIVGTLPGVQCGETLTLFGEWTTHSQHGEQFKVESFESRLPATVYGIRKYLGSGLIEGIGPKYAERIVNHFGADTLRVISEESKRLQEVEGIGRNRATAIKQAWEEQRAVREMLIFLQTYGVTTSQCVRLVKRYGSNAKSIVQSDPYRLARDIDRIGFRTADRIARNLGFPNDCQPRIQAGILHALAEQEEEGHTCLPAQHLVGAAASLLELEGERITAEMGRLVEARQLESLPRPAGKVYQLPATFRAETLIAHHLGRLLTGPSALPPIAVDRAVAWAQDKAGFAFAPEQAEAIAQALRHKCTILTGGPGTGKTTILRALVEILRAKQVKLLLASPTGRAAQRLAESAGHPAATIHRLLKFDASQGGFFHGTEHPLPASFLIVDEASMIDTRLAASLLAAVGRRCHLLLVGDSDQLPSVGAGNVLHDLIASRRVPVTRLQRIFRQEETSGIVTMAHAILHGQATLPYSAERSADLRPEADFHFVLAPDPETCVAKTLALADKVIPAAYGLDPIADVQVLAPMHKGTAGIQNLNTALQARLNPPEAARARAAASAHQTRQAHFREKTARAPVFEVPFGDTVFRVGDKVMQTKNNYDAGRFNGDIGRLTGIGPDGRTLLADFGGPPQEIPRGEWHELTSAYAISVHKSQGSEYPIVLIPLLRQHFIMLQRNLIYTAITRGRRKVFLIGDPSAFQMAVRNADSTQRQTDLPHKLFAPAEPPAS